MGGGCEKGHFEADEGRNAAEKQADRLRDMKNRWRQQDVKITYKEPPSPNLHRYKLDKLFIKTLELRRTSRAEGAARIKEALVCTWQSDWFKAVSFSQSRVSNVITVTKGKNNNHYVETCACNKKYYMAGWLLCVCTSATGLCSTSSSPVPQLSWKFIRSISGQFASILNRNPVVV